jgi:hypothetical protein
MLLFGHCSLYRFNFILDPHNIVAVELSANASLNTLDKGAAPAD